MTVPELKDSPLSYVLYLLSLAIIFSDCFLIFQMLVSFLQYLHSFIVIRFLLLWIIATLFLVIFTWCCRFDSCCLFLLMLLCFILSIRGFLHVHGPLWICLLVRVAAVHAAERWYSSISLNAIPWCFFALIAVQCFCLGLVSECWCII